MLLAFALTMVVLILFQQFVLKRFAPQQPAESKPAQQQVQQQQAQPMQPSPPVSNGPNIPAPTNANAAIAAAPGRKVASTEQQTVIETSLYKITFTNKGAEAHSWVLKKYDDDFGHPLELVNAVGAPQYGYPLSLFAYDEGLRGRLRDGLYTVEQKHEGNKQTLSYEFADGDLQVTKRFEFEEGTYQVRLETEVRVGGNRVNAYPAWPSGFGDETVASSYAAGRVDFERGDKIERRPQKKVGGGETITGPFYWAGALDQYFAAIFLPDDPNSSDLVTFNNSISIPKNLEKPNPNETQKVEVLGAAVGSRVGRTSERIFVGPKALDIVDRVQAYSSTASAGVAPNGPTLGNIVDWGFFGIIAKPLFLWLRWTYQHWVANWGWSILVLTVIINAVLLPLRFSTMKSGLKMQKVQPQVAAINNRYKQYKLTDPRQADKNREIQDLYKKEGINPLGGCVPSLLQLPFLYAFYAMLGNTIELRHGHWLWIRDLSAPDAWHIIPVFFVVSMFIMQKMTPQGGMDPAQQKMLQVMMPVMLGVISWNLAAGLNIYWAASNVIGIIQQLVFNQTKFAKEIRAHMAARKPR